MKSVQQMLDEDMKQSFRKAIDNAFNYQQPDYYPKRKYGKWTIYGKDGMRVAWGLNEKEMKAYMKLLKTEE
jgi:hypothetical protein